MNGPATANSSPRALVADPEGAAAAARLRYVSDSGPGLRRVRKGRGFGYLMPDGGPVRDVQTLARIRSLAIPPAWTEVWICPSPEGHIQAVGRDARRRKQYLYHPRWREVRDETKYARLVEFGRALPRLRRRVRQDLKRPGLPREKVLATMVRLLETTLIRVGNEEYARQNRSYGLTTLRSRHVRVRGNRLRFEFRGKGGKLHVVDVSDRRIARIVQRCQDLPGHELFQYVDDTGARQTVDSADVNDYLQAVTGRDFTAKDFRTWAGTVLAALMLCQPAPGSSPTKKRVTTCVGEVAQRLGNTPTISRKCYIHPHVIEAYLEGALTGELPVPAANGPSGDRLNAAERAVLAFLERRARCAVTRRQPRASERTARRLAAVTSSPNGSKAARRSTSEGS